jgi:tRNA pseudouridine38-40 synthase
MRYVLEVMYDGTRFHGSQVQGAHATVQLALNNTLATIFRRPIPTFGASRTDEGVHALSNFYHFDLEEELSFDLQYKCNAILPPSLAVRKIYRAADTEFNARFAATSRSYRYRIYAAKNPFLHERALYYPFSLNRDILDQTAAILKEYEHFEAFSKRKSQTKTFICRITQSYWQQSGEELHYVVEANRFLRGMVRGLVGTQLHFAREKSPLSEFRKIIEQGDNTKAYFDVPGHGLYLEKIAYPEGLLKEVVVRPG